MGATSISLGVLSVCALAFVMAIESRGAYKTADAVGVGLSMVLVWAVSMAANAWLPEPQSRLLNPVMDMMLAVGILAATVSRFKWWKLAFLCLLGAEAAAHVIYQAEYRTAGILGRYILLLNVAYILQLACICAPGVGYVARVAGDHLRGSGSWHSVARHR